MGKGSSKQNNEKNQDRKFYTFTLSTLKEDDKELIEFLKNRSTTGSVKEGLRLLKKQTEQQGQPAVNSINPDALQALLLLLGNNSNQLDLSSILPQLNQNNQNPAKDEQSATKEASAPVEVVKAPEPVVKKELNPKKVKNGKSKASAAMANYDF
ncbi:hypothetical protein AKG34_21310 [Peribacillus butanolivorans]|uniref:hypothetical protein n=1 Tax=Peribacillus butanolivorans TaxID=421767 RepID=UPI0006A70589|nr:hypothetical protein [Peribacillus butanolivorans]KON67361.1 hypothetical protein AKG34_21310 [Peribacillus butanolivorans]